MTSWSVAEIKNVDDVFFTNLSSLSFFYVIQCIQKVSSASLNPLNLLQLVMAVKVAEVVVAVTEFPKYGISKVFLFHKWCFRNTILWNTLSTSV